jgi:hypothetical protein
VQLTFQTVVGRVWHNVISSRKGMVVAGVALGALLAVGVLGLSRHEAEPPPSPAVDEATETASPTAPEPTTPQTVRISVDSFPQGAQIQGPKGQLLGITPQTIALPHDTQSLALVLALEGYDSATVTVIPDINKPVFAKLEPAAASKAKAGVRAPIKRRGKAMPLDPFAD